MVKKIIYILVFLVSIILVIKGNSVNGYNGLLMMHLGLSGLLGELYSYNKKYQ